MEKTEAEQLDKGRWSPCKTPSLSTPHPSTRRITLDHYCHRNTRTQPEQFSPLELYVRHLKEQRQTNKQTQR